MKVVVQRVKEASVIVDERTVGTIKQGILVLLGIHKADHEEKIPWLINKLINLRIFSDENDKMNLSVQDISGGVLVVSQFTLYGNCNNGRRPDFVESARPELAKPLYDTFVAQLRKEVPLVQTGEFGAYMQLHLINDGPVTFILEN